MVDDFFASLVSISKYLGSLKIKATGESVDIKEIKIRNNRVEFVVETTKGAYKELDLSEVDIPGSYRE